MCTGTDVVEGAHGPCTSLGQRGLALWLLSGFSSHWKSICYVQKSQGEDRQLHPAPQSSAPAIPGYGFYDIKILLCFLVLLFLMTLWKLRLSLY